MAVFAIYQILLGKATNPNLFRNMDGQKIRVEGNEQFFFGELFHRGAGLNVNGTRKDGTPIIYENKVVSIHDDVILMRFCNEKYVTLVKDYESKKEKSNPWCYVIIDNRPGRCMMAIQKSSSFEGETDKVRDLLQSTFSAQLDDIGISVEINAKLNKEILWDVIHDRCVVHKDTISKVVLDMDKKKLKESKTLKGEKEIVDYAAKTLAIAESINAMDAMIQFGGQNSDLRLGRTAKQDTAIELLVDLCCDNGFDVVVTFRKFGEYHLRKDNKSMITLKDTELEDFITGQMVAKDEGEDLTFALIQWLEIVREKTKDFENEVQTITGGQRSGKR